MLYLLLDSTGVIDTVTDRPCEKSGFTTISYDTSESPGDLLGRKVISKEIKDLKVAVICNWRSECGISTYAGFLVESLRSKVGEIKIFSEIGPNTYLDHKDNCVRCWKRGNDMRSVVKDIRTWGADFVLVQHEFGIFPIATHFLKLLDELGDFPYAVVLHSVYRDHLDKTVHTAAIKNIICHTPAAKKILIGLGHDAAGIQVIPHGCVVMENVKELWNCFQTPHAIFQFGFGFKYKGVDRAIEAVAHLKNTDPKFKDIFYCYMCSVSPQSKPYHSEYYKFLKKRVEELGVENNVAIIQKFQSDQIINNYLRTAKLAIFPYLVDPDNTVYGATGAARIAIANGLPVILSESHLFDDFEGILPRPKDHLELAKSIDEVFSNNKYRSEIVSNGQSYIKNNSWEITADRYLAAFEKILSSAEFLRIS